MLGGHLRKVRKMRPHLKCQTTRRIADRKSLSEYLRIFFNYSVVISAPMRGGMSRGTSAGQQVQHLKSG